MRACSKKTNVIAAYEFATQKLFLKLTDQKDCDTRFLKIYILCYIITFGLFWEYGDRKYILYLAQEKVNTQMNLQKTGFKTVTD